MPKQLIDIPLSAGTLPNFNIRLGNPQLFNMYYNDGALYCTPGLLVIASLPNLRQLHYTPFNGGAYIAVTGDIVYKIGLDGSQTIVAAIVNTGGFVRIDENLQNQITITDEACYVFDQNAATFTKITATQGLDARLVDVISVVVIDTYTIILSSSGYFQISTPNNALEYNNPPLVGQIQSILTKGAGLASLDNNLYIIGTTGAERWEAFNTNDYAFPFVRDNNFRSDFGALSPGSIVRGIDEVYFLSHKFMPVVLTMDGVYELINDKLDMNGRSEKSAGIARVIGGYSDNAQALGSFYTNKGNYFYHLTFPTTGIAWINNVKNRVYATSDDLIVTGLPDNEIVGLVDGMYSLHNTPTPSVTKRRTFVPPRMRAYKGQQPYRNSINGFEVRMVQGNFQPIEPQLMELSLSQDSLTYGNVVQMPIGLTGQRQAVTTWRCNVTCQEITPKFEYYGDLDLCIEQATMYIS